MAVITFFSDQLNCFLVPYLFVASTGFMKIKAPDSLINLLVKHWERNKDSKKEEKWPAGNTYTNHWAAPTYMVSVEDTGLRGGGSHLKNAVWDAAKDTIEQWTGMELKPISQYGIRMYTEGAVLAPHVDRLPLVSSCIVNVAQDVDEDWPLEVYGKSFSLQFTREEFCCSRRTIYLNRVSVPMYDYPSDRNGNAVNVTMQPGDMVLYESHSLIHGRPFPLKGRYFANIFIHFEPTGKRLFETEFNSDHDVDDDLPPYIIKGSPEVENWKRRNPGGWKKMPSPSAAHVDSPEVHAAAASGDVEHLQRIAKVDKKKLDQKDRNGWAPIHEAARGGQKEAAELLVRHGADVNHRTNRGKGPTPLHLVILNHGERHPLAQYLKEIGALDIGPEL